MPLQIIKIARGKYQVVNLDTGKIHAHSTSLKKAERQVHLINSLEGDGILDTFKTIADRLTFKKRENGVLPPSSRNLLARIKDEPIQSLVIVRTPISSYINSALQML